jgi:hypothetical protein
MPLLNFSPVQYVLLDIKNKLRAKETKQNKKKPCKQEGQEQNYKSQVQWCMAVIPTVEEAKVEGLLALKSVRSSPATQEDPISKMRE